MELRSWELTKGQVKSRRASGAAVVEAAAIRIHDGKGSITGRVRCPAGFAYCLLPVEPRNELNDANRSELAERRDMCTAVYDCAGMICLAEQTSLAR